MKRNPSHPCKIHRRSVPLCRLELDLASRSHCGFVESMPQPSDDASHVECAVGSKRHFQQDFAFEVQFARLFRVHRLRLIENFDLSGQCGGIIQHMVTGVRRHLLRREPGSLHSLAIGAPISVARLSNAISEDRKSTRLNSSHEWISYAVFCLKKKKK